MRQNSEFPAKLRVLAEYESSGIWLWEPQGVSMLEHDELGLPHELSEELYQWIGLYSERLKPSVAARCDLDQFNAIGRRLARKLKDFVGPDIAVEYIPELPGDFDGPPEVIG